MTLIIPKDRIAIFGARGMAGSAIGRALERAGYHLQLNPSRADLDLLNPLTVQQWFTSKSRWWCSPQQWAVSVRPTLTLRTFCWKI